MCYIHKLEKENTMNNAYNIIFLDEIARKSFRQIKYRVTILNELLSQNKGKIT